ncbi:hypothetical protein DFJ63DRAFT_321134 [Scheffersomyces coipomensis]|uniref:uncharacterized protein n=1 Tax=Scheffersomyces coipomensis TaxID=1788519 RepID=UPI00315D0D81
MRTEEISLTSSNQVYFQPQITIMSKEDSIKSGSVKESKKDKRDRKDAKKNKSKKRSSDVLEEEVVVEDQEESKEEEEEEQEQDNDDEEEEHDANPKHTDYEEIAIDLNAGIPLSKKQQRRLKKGKLDLEKLAKKHPAPKPELSPEEQAKQDEEEKKTKKSEYAVWIGNLSFDTTKEDLVRFIVGKTSHIDESNSDLVKLEESDITRVNLPKKDNKIKGFAYVDFANIKQVNTVVSLSESPLNGRKLLIKNATSFEGRPQQSPTASLSKNPPSRILFVGNLSFDTTQELLDEHFRAFGDIIKVRMATFEDTGKCKGFAFIDYKDEAGPTAALKSKLAKKLINRPLRLEFGEDRSKRTPNHIRKLESQVEEGEVRESSFKPVSRERNEGFEAPAVDARPIKKRVIRDDFKSNNNNNNYNNRNNNSYNDHNNNNGKRLKSSVALATAQRASAAIVPSSGKKITFD